MAEVTKLLYIVVVDGEDKREKEKESFRYTRAVLQSTLQLMGCKARHAFKISKRVFELMKTSVSVDAWVSTGVEMLERDALKEQSQKENGQCTSGCACQAEVSKLVVPERDVKSKSKPFELYKQRTTVVARRKTFLDVVCDALAEYKHVGPNQREDLLLACRIRERKESVTVFLCGTSGCGKSTLSALLGSRLGITTVISTDSIRHMMRSFVDEKQNPLLWASTYHAGECLDPEAVAAAKDRRKAKKLAGVPKLPPKADVSDGSRVGKSDSRSPEVCSSSAELISPRQMAVEGFKAQSEMVIDSLDRLITSWEERKESVVVEGVHLSLNFVMGLMKKHPSIIPFMIYISNEGKHLQRFAVRAKYMTLDPAKNKYVKYIRNIRTIQQYLCNRADKHLVPKINNTNVDKSVAAIHATVFSCLRRRFGGEQIYDPGTNTVRMVEEEYTNQCAANSLSSKGMFQLIQRKGSTRHLMAFVNTDGSVAKAWPIDWSGKPVECQSAEKGIGTAIYGPLKICKAEPVNLQFGHFGISTWWPNSCGTSHASSVDGSRGEIIDNGSRYHSSSCSSPGILNGPAKELKEEHSVHGSDEEIDDPLEVDSDDDLSDDGRTQIPEEMEGSVDEGSTKSDEEYDDLAMQDIHENGCWPGDEEFKDKEVINISGEEPTHEVAGTHKGKGIQSLDNFLGLKSELFSELPCNSFRPREKNEKRLPSYGNVKMRKHSQSIWAFGNHGPVTKDTILSGTKRQQKHCVQII